jgi:hypothetical protein
VQGFAAGTPETVRIRPFGRAKKSRRVTSLPFRASEKRLGIILLIGIITISRDFIGNRVDNPAIIMYYIENSKYQ